MRISTIAGLAAIFTMAARCQTLTPAERERAAAELEASGKLLGAALTGLSASQAGFKPAPGRWSIAECVEHIAVTEDHYYQLITGKLLKSPPDPAKRAEVRGKDEEVLAKMPDRSSKRITTPALEPVGRWPTPAEALRHFQASRARLIDYVRTTKDDLRDHFQAHRAVGLIDGYQWILLASGHVRRHVQQIEEVKASPGYPDK